MKLSKTRADFIERIRKHGKPLTGFDRRNVMELAVESILTTNDRIVEHPQRHSVSDRELARILLEEKAPQADYRPFAEPDDTLPRRGLITRVMFDDEIHDLSVNLIRAVKDDLQPDGVRFEEDVCTIDDIINLESVLEFETRYAVQE